MLDKVINGYSNPGYRFCVGIARAFRMPLEEVLRKAGLLPSEPPETASTREVVHLFTLLSDADQERALVYLRAMLERQREEEQRAATAKAATGNTGA